MKAANLRKWLIPCFLIFGLLIVSPAQNSSRFIEQVQQYQDTIKFDKSNLYMIFDPTFFNMNYYLKMFNRIQFDTRLEYDYEFLNDGLNLNPYIYVRSQSFNQPKNLDQKAYYALKASKRTRISKSGKLGIVHPNSFQFQNDSAHIDPEKEILASDEEEYYRLTHQKLVAFLNDSINRAYHHIVPEDSEEGYIQYLFFHEMGEQFSPKWKANYKAKSVICNANDVKQIIKEYTNNPSIECNSKDLKRLLEIDLTPIVKPASDQYVITWYEIETQKGIYKRTYAISRSVPYKIQLIDNKLLVDIICDFSY
jgi:hypothetical protein